MPIMQDVIDTYSLPCSICGVSMWDVLYHGQIRMGKYGQWSKKEHTIWKCKSCQAGFLPTASIDNYETAEYRNMVDGDESVEHYYACHDKEQAARLAILGTDNLRGKVVADVGCGGGSFLDLIGGLAKKTVAIEPCRGYQQALGDKGHSVYSYTADALQEYEGQVDIAVSFAVLEHISDPLLFLQEIRKLLKPEGLLFLSTPNYDDWLIKFMPEVYAPFFFRRAHTWYFNEKAISCIATRAGFTKNPEIQFVQRFDMSNALYWIRDNKPTGLGNMSLFKELDGLYQSHLAQKKQTDFMYVYLKNS